MTLRNKKLASPVSRYGLGMAALILAFSVRIALAPYFHGRYTFALPTLAIIITAWFSGFRATLLTTILGYCVAVVTLVPPYYTLNFESSADVIGAVSYLAIYATVVLIVYMEEAAQRRAVASAAAVDEERQERARALTERVRAESALRYSEEWSRFALEAGGYGYWDFNVLTGRISWSETLQKIHGRAIKDETDPAAAYFDHIYAEDREACRHAFERSLRDGQPYAMEYRVVRPDGKMIWLNTRAKIFLDEAGTPFRVAGICVDVTEQRLGQERERFLAEVSSILAASLDYETTLANVARSVVPRMAAWCTVDLVGEGGRLDRVATVHQDPEVTAWAQALAAECPPDFSGVREVLRTGVSSLYPDIAGEPLVKGALGEEHLEHLRQAGFRSIMIVPLVAHARPLGTISFIAATSGRSYGPGDLAFAEELGRRAGLAVDNARLYRDATTANRLKDEFLATLSHELRTPLNVISGWADLLALDLVEPEEHGAAIEAIQRNARAQAQLVGDLLDVSRAVTGKLRIEPKPIDFAGVLHAAIETIQLAAEAKRIRLTVDVVERAVVKGDPDRLQQVAWNLLTNALKFTPEGGRVEVRLQRQASEAVLDVQDNGQGIDPEFLPFVFERFRQEDSGITRRHGGLGLGLAIVRHLTELHGGEVRVASAGKGRGTKFTVTLPLYNTAETKSEDVPCAAAEFPVSTPPEPGDLALRGLRILVVDDEPSTLVLLGTMLRRHGAVVSVADSARRAYELVAAEQPDILLSDIGMPDEDGYSLIRRIRSMNLACCATIPAVALTAYARDEERRRVLDAGFQNHMAKPFEMARLVQILAELGRGAATAGTPVH